jgi:peptidoglycan/xylan/chitin deacetylase (PgdA/CDA1 family)
MDEIRRRRKIRHRQEQRRRAAIRRRNVLLCVALASAVIGAAVGAGAGGTPGVRGRKVAALPRGGVGQPVAAGQLVPWKGPVPVLMYHVIANPPPSAQLPELFVDPDTFQRQMAALKRRGYTAVTLNQVHDAWFGGGMLPRKPIVLTFDDGYRGDYVYARRTLAGLHWPGDLNLLVGNLGTELTDPMVRRMIAEGWEVDAHTISHLDLTQMTGARLHREVAGSREILRRRFHQPVNFFCYPAGKFNAATVREVRRAGYLGATTELPGEASRSDPYRLHRIRVDGSDGVGGLERKLRGAGA